VTALCLTTSSRSNRRKKHYPCDAKWYGPYRLRAVPDHHYIVVSPGRSRYEVCASCTQKAITELALGAEKQGIEQTKGDRPAITKLGHAQAKSPSHEGIAGDLDRTRPRALAGKEAAASGGGIAQVFPA
jgi:hypothetical protein